MNGWTLSGAFRTHYSLHCYEIVIINPFIKVVHLITIRLMSIHQIPGRSSHLAVHVIQHLGIRRARMARMALPQSCRAVLRLTNPTVCPTAHKMPKRARICEVAARRAPS